MSKRLLQAYIKEVVEAHMARVPDQLVSDDVEEEGLDEFSGVGAIAGYTAPLGMDPDLLGRRKNEPKRK